MFTLRPELYDPTSLKLAQGFGKRLRGEPAMPVSLPLMAVATPAFAALHLLPQPRPTSETTAYGFR